MLFGHDVCGLLHGVGGYDNAVVGFCIRRGDVTFEEHTDNHLVDCVRFGGFIADDFVQADVVLAITCC